MQTNLAEVLEDEKVSVREQITHFMDEVERPRLASKKRCLSPCIQTRTHRAPEVIITEKHYDEKIDIWGAGIVLAELLSAITIGKQ